MEMELELEYCIDHHDSKLSVQDWTDPRILANPSLSHESPFHFEASCILGINVAKVVLLL